MVSHEKKQLNSFKFINLLLLFIIILILIPIIALTINNKNLLIYSMGQKTALQQIAFNNKTDICLNVKMLSECHLEPADILIKREITERTDILVKIFNLYFTHSAIYSGNGYIVEAKGFHSKNNDDITEERIQNTGWNSDKIKSWVILRPLTDASNRQNIVRVAKQYAVSPDKKFGISINNRSDNSVYCSQLVWDIFKEANYPIKESNSIIISPDELFSLLQSDHNRFQIVSIRNL